MPKTPHPILGGQRLACVSHCKDIVVGDAEHLAVRLFEMPSASNDLIRSPLPLDDASDAPPAVMRGPAGTDAMYRGFGRIAGRAEERAMGMKMVEPAGCAVSTASAYAVISSGERRLHGKVDRHTGVVLP